MLFTLRSLGGKITVKSHAIDLPLLKQPKTCVDQKNDKCWLSGFPMWTVKPRGNYTYHLLFLQSDSENWTAFMAGMLGQDQAFLQIEKERELIV